MLVKGFRGDDGEEVTVGSQCLSQGITFPRLTPLVASIPVVVRAAALCF